LITWMNEEIQELSRLNCTWRREELVVTGFS